MVFSVCGSMDMAQVVCYKLFIYIFMLCLCYSDNLSFLNSYFSGDYWLYWLGKYGPSHGNESVKERVQLSCV